MRMRGAKRRMRILRGGMSHPTMDATSACTTLSHVSYAALFCVCYTVERLFAGIIAREHPEKVLKPEILAQRCV
jgi:hypothetical protein